MTIEDRIRNHMHATPDPNLGGDLFAVKRAGARRRRNSQIGAAVAGGALAIGAVVGASQLVDNDATQVDIAVPAEESTTTTAPELPSEADQASAIGPVDAFSGPSDWIVGVSDGFAGLRQTESGTLAIRSSDGLEWDETPTIGLPDPEAAFLSAFAHDDGTFVAVFQTIEESESMIGGPPTGPILLAYSTDLVEWTAEQLPFDTSEGTSGHPGNLEVADGRVVVLVTVFPDYIDPALVLLEAGVLDEDQLEQACGFDTSGPGGPIVVYSCDFGDLPVSEEDGGTTEATSPITVGPGDDSEQVLIQVEPGDVGYEDLAEALFEETGDELGPTTVAISGPVGGPYVTAELPDSFQSSTLVRADGVFASFGYGPNGPLVLASPDGVTWTTSTLAQDAATNGVVGFDDAVVTVQAEGARVRVSRSVDGGTTWSDSFVDLENPIYQSWYSESGSGAAGTAVLVTGSADEIQFEDELLPNEPLLLQVDDFTASFEFGGDLVVTNFAGDEVMRIDDWENEFDGGGEIGPGLARFEGENEEVLVFLDPETGEDLFRLTEVEFTEAMEALIGDADTESGVLYSDPAMGVALLVTTDGVNWRQVPIPDLAVGLESASLAGVGDDEVLLSIWSFNEPAFEGETSAAESEFAEPQVEYVRIPLD